MLFTLDVFYFYNSFACDARDQTQNQQLKKIAIDSHHAKIFCIYDITIGPSPVIGIFETSIYKSYYSDI